MMYQAALQLIVIMGGVKLAALFFWQPNRQWHRKIVVKIGSVYSGDFSQRY